MDQRVSQSQKVGDLLVDIPVGVLAVDRTYTMRSINTAARRLLRIHGLALGEDLIHLVQGVVATTLRRTIDAAFAGAEPTQTEALVTTETTPGATLSLQITCTQCETAPEDTSSDLVTIVIADLTTVMHDWQTRARAHTGEHEILGRLEARLQDLVATNSQLLAVNMEQSQVIAELQTAVEGARARTEVAQDAVEQVKMLNEQLQAANEELETLGEHLQAMVEEAGVANEELQTRSSELQALASVLEAHRAQLAVILESISDGVLVVDKTGTPVLTNTAYAEMFGPTGALPEDERGQPLLPEAFPHRRITQGESFSMQFALRPADGPPRWFEARGQPLQYAGAEGGVVVVRDITAPSRQRWLQDNFIALASHELRTPLTAVLGYLQIVLASLRPAPDDERTRGAANSALRQARRLAILVRDLLDVTRLETGKLTLARDPVDLGPLVALAVEAAQVLARGQTLYATADSATVVVIGDAGRLEQILLNLLTNAITYAPGTSRIDVRLRHINDTAIIEVHDDGPGITQDIQARLFTRFSQGEHGEQPYHSGLGLGLFLCRELVTAHKGTITLHSIPGQGATFTVCLPAPAALNRMET